LSRPPAPPPAGPALCLSVGLLAAAVVAAEVLLPRLLSVVLWHHFAYLVVSLALLGLGAAGTVLALAREAALARFERLYPLLCVLFAAGFAGASARAAHAPFNPLALGWDAREGLALVGLAAVVLLPFLAAGGAVGLALMRHAARPARLYGADLVGAGGGAIAAVVALEQLTLAGALAAVVALGLAAALAASAAALGPTRLLAGALAGLLAVGLLATGGWLDPVPSPYKGLSLALRAPGARVIAERSGALGQLSVVASPRVPIRHAPGLSLAAPSGPPGQLALFVDGDGPAPLVELGDGAWLDWLPEALAYALGAPRRRVLVLGAPGGAALARAVAHGAQVVAVEANGKLLELLGEAFWGGRARGPWRSPQVRLVRAEARSFLARERHRYDLIELPLAGDRVAAGAGLQALAASRLYTVEGLGAALARLAPGGLLVVPVWLRQPPRASVKLLATAIEALRRAGVRDPGARLLLVRGWQTAALLVRRGPFSGAEIEAARRFAASRRFDLAWYPGMAEGEANRRNRWPAPYLYRAARALLGPGAAAFLRDYKFEVRPASDDRPFFDRFLRWRTLPELLALRSRAGLAQLDWGYPVLVASGVLVAALGAVLVLVPLALWGRAGRGGRLWRPLLPFALVGLAFMLVEMAFIARLEPFLGHPTRALSVALAAFLVFAGLGSLASGQVGRTLRHPTAAACAATALLALLAIALLPSLLGALVALPDGARMAVAVAAIAPLAALMGMPFPLLLAPLGAARPALVPWAWGVNGLASVLATTLGALLAVHLGFRAVLMLAAALYLGAALAAGRR